MPSDWKSRIIRMTEHPAARASKIDASFFPPASKSLLAEVERRSGFDIPPEFRDYLAVSDGLEAQRGEIWPILPLSRWKWIDDLRAVPVPAFRFGESPRFRYLVFTDDSPTIHRHDIAGAEVEFFARNLTQYLEKIFRGEG